MTEMLYFADKIVRVVVAICGIIWVIACALLVLWAAGNMWGTIKKRWRARK